MTLPRPDVTARTSEIGAPSDPSLVAPAVDALDRSVRAVENVVDPRPSAEAVPPAGSVPARVAVRRGRGASLVALVGLAGFAGLFALVRAGRSQAFDVALTLKLQRGRSPGLSRLMAGASWPGFPPQSRLITPTVMVGLWMARLRLEAVALAAGWGTALLSTMVKAVMRRPRPMIDERVRVITAPLGGSSFPSGHVITYVGTYGLLAFLAHTLVRPPGPRRLLTGGLLALVAAVGPSRIHQGHHWPTDVTASYLLGTSYLIMVTSTYRRLKARRAGVRA